MQTGGHSSSVRTPRCQRGESGSIPDGRIYSKNLCFRIKAIYNYYCDYLELEDINSLKEFNTFSRSEGTNLIAPACL